MSDTSDAGEGLLTQPSLVLESENSTGSGVEQWGENSDAPLLRQRHRSQKVPFYSPVRGGEMVGNDRKVVRPGTARQTLGRVSDRKLTGPEKTAGIRLRPGKRQARKLFGWRQTRLETGNFRTALD